MPLDFRGDTPFLTNFLVLPSLVYSSGTFCWGVFSWPDEHHNVVTECEGEPWELILSVNSVVIGSALYIWSSRKF